ncbi:MAG TPA: signal recognition particle-docking protein FtsY [Candidatus Saccharimonadales bacterium]|nr:signal recognition particle-docking protein FtsY [Candidatus Saccharimonadales bacterium]
MFEKLKSGLNVFVQKISQKELSEKDVNRILEEFVLILVQNDVAYDVAKKICDDIRLKLESVQVKRFSGSTEPAREVLQSVLIELLRGSGDTSFFDVLEKCKNDHRSAVILFVGVNGTGKTSSIAKIGHLLLSKDYSVVIAAADTYRTGSIEQIEEHARRIGIKTIRHDYGGDSAAVAFDAVNYAKAHGINVVLIDTAGRMQTNKNLLEEMKKISRVAQPDLTILVVDALTGNDAIEQGRIFSESVKLDGVILTKLDADTKGGSAISMATIIGKPILFAAVGQNYEDLVPFSPEQMVAKIIS